MAITVSSTSLVTPTVTFATTFNNVTSVGSLALSEEGKLAIPVHTKTRKEQNYSIKHTRSLQNG